MAHEKDARGATRAVFGRLIAAVAFAFAASRCGVSAMELTEDSVDSMRSELHALGSGALYVGCRGGNRQLYRLDAATGTVTGTATLGGGTIDVVAIKQVDKLYSTDESDNALTVFALDTLATLGRVPTGSKPHHAGVNNSGSQLYVAEFGAPTIAVLDTATDSVVRYSAGTVGTLTHDAEGTADGKSIWATNYLNDSSKAGSIVELDAATGAELRRIAVGKEPSEVLATADRKTAYTSLRGENVVKAYDLDTDALVATYAVGAQPDTLSLSSNGKTLFVGLRAEPSATAAIVDLEMGTVVKVKVPGTTTGHNDVTPNGKYAFIATEGTTGVAVVDIAAASVSAFYPVSCGAGGRPHGVDFVQE
jgi:DNA-binding beta-propeller fold protein YncE